MPEGAAVKPPVMKLAASLASSRARQLANLADAAKDYKYTPLDVVPPVGTYTSRVINSCRVAVIMPAYNAAETLSRVVAEFDRTIIDDLVLVDDCSTDHTVVLARELGLDPIRHDVNKGYGGNQKTCYGKALELGADIVVMIHPDYQYSPKLAPAMAAMIAYGEYDMVLGSRILAQNSVKQRHAGLQVRRQPRSSLHRERPAGPEAVRVPHRLARVQRRVLASLPFDRNSDDFVFDNQMIAQAIVSVARVGELSCPTRYMDEASSINLRRSIKYGFGVLQTSVDCWQAQHGLRKKHYLDFDPVAERATRLPGGFGSVPPSSQSRTEQ